LSNYSFALRTPYPFSCTSPSYANSLYPGRLSIYLQRSHIAALLPYLRTCCLLPFCPCYLHVRLAWSLWASSVLLSLPRSSSSDPTFRSSTSPPFCASRPRPVCRLDEAGAGGLGGFAFNIASSGNPTGTARQSLDARATWVLLSFRRSRLIVISPWPANDRGYGGLRWPSHTRAVYLALSFRGNESRA
jgi:hypothetical protein